MSMRVKSGHKRCPECLCAVCSNGGIDMIYPYLGPTPNEVNCLEFGTTQIPHKTCTSFELHVSESA